MIIWPPQKGHCGRRAGPVPALGASSCSTGVSIGGARAVINHGKLGPLVSQFEGTLDQLSGDGIMVFFQRPCPDRGPGRPCGQHGGLDAQGSLGPDRWLAPVRRELGCGAGIAEGHAVLGQIGFSECSGYTAIGTVCNVAARLCAELLISQRVAVRLDDNIAPEDIGALTLKGLTQPVAAFSVPLAASQPAFRVVEGGPPSA